MKDNPDDIQWNTFPIDNKRKRTSFEQYLSSKSLVSTSVSVSSTTTTATTLLTTNPIIDTINNNDINHPINSTIVDQENNNIDSIETKYRKIKNVLSMVK